MNIVSEALYNQYKEKSRKYLQQMQANGKVIGTFSFK
jgi:hypothetical protein